MVDNKVALIGKKIQIEFVRKKIFAIYYDINLYLCKDKIYSTDTCKFYDGIYIDDMKGTLVVYGKESSAIYLAVEEDLSLKFEREFKHTTALSDTLMSSVVSLHNDYAYRTLQVGEKARVMSAVTEDDQGIAIDLVCAVDGELGEVIVRLVSKHGYVFERAKFIRYKDDGVEDMTNNIGVKDFIEREAGIIG